MNIKTRRCQSVSVHKRIVNPSDPTEMIEIQGIRNDGLEFQITLFFDTWILKLGRKMVVPGIRVKDETDWIRKQVKKHYLPNIDWLLDKYEKALDQFASDPMTIHYGCNTAEFRALI